MHSHANSLNHDPEQQTLERAAHRLLQLLQMSKHPEADKDLVDTMLSRADLWTHNPPPGISLWRWCNQMITENYLLYGAVNHVRSRPQSWDLIESVEELMHHLIPSEGDRQQ